MGFGREGGKKKKKNWEWLCFPPRQERGVKVESFFCSVLVNDFFYSFFYDFFYSFFYLFKY